MGHEGLSLQRLGSVICSCSQVPAQNQDGKLTQEAQEAVARVLEEAGLSPEDAADVVSKAPVYIREVVEFVTTSEADYSAAGGEGVGTRNRIYELVNHGRGRSPFLESLGVHLPSISRISASLSSQRLPDLLSKVCSRCNSLDWGGGVAFLHADGAQGMLWNPTFTFVSLTSFIVNRQIVLDVTFMAGLIVNSA